MNNEEMFKELKQGKDVRDQIIENNLGICWLIAKQYQVSDELDDLFQIACIGLIKAVDSYEIEKGAFLPFLRVCINNELKCYLRYKKRRPNCLSLDEPIGENITMGDRLVDPFNMDELINDLAVRLKVEEIYPSLTETEKKVYLYNCLLEKSYEETASLVGRSRSNVGKMKKKIRDMLIDIM